MCFEFSSVLGKSYGSLKSEGGSGPSARKHCTKSAWGAWKIGVRDVGRRGLTRISGGRRVLQMEGLEESLRAELSREVASLLKRWLQRYKQVDPP